MRYRDAGVDLDRAEAVTARLRAHVGTSLFGGFLPVPALTTYDAPVLVSSIDGIGTKVALAALLRRLESLGDDIVHHCVNDIAVHGARPLLFLDYLALHRLDPDEVEAIVGGIARACARLGIALVGGETAEMPAVYPPGRFDLAGAVVGVVERDAIVTGSDICPEDLLVGFTSAGLHTNGYSLVQRLFSDSEYGRYEPALGEELGAALLRPHRCYLREIEALLATGAVHGMAHITGGGIPGNLARIVPAGLSATVQLPEPPPLFDLMARRGVSREEMTRVFNMGIGLIAVCHPRVADELPEGALVLGSIDHGKRSVTIA